MIHSVSAARALFTKSSYLPVHSPTSRKLDVDLRSLIWFLRLTGFFVEVISKFAPSCISSPICQDEEGDGQDDRIYTAQRSHDRLLIEPLRTYASVYSKNR